MSYNTVILLLGTNLGNKNNNLITAKSFIQKEVGEIIKESKIIETEAEGYVSENLFLNQTIQIQTELSPINLLDKIKLIEMNMGRVYPSDYKGQKYADRLIDIDILIFNQLDFQSKRLTIPHHQIKTRSFVESLLTFY